MDARLEARAAVCRDLGQAPVGEQGARKLFSQGARNELRTHPTFPNRPSAIAHNGHQDIVRHDAMAGILSGRALFQVAFAGDRGREHSPHKS
jgi:hypothetical protein